MNRELAIEALEKERATALANRTGKTGADFRYWQEKKELSDFLLEELRYSVVDDECRGALRQAIEESDLDELSGIPSYVLAEYASKSLDAFIKHQGTMVIGCVLDAKEDNDDED